MVLELNNINKFYGKLQAVNNISFSLSKGELISLIGPSGAGKTTLLKIIAGIETNFDGSVQFHEQPSGPHPHAILVFQEYFLFPHLSIYNNIAFGLRARKFSKKAIAARVKPMLEYFDISQQADKYPGQLSSGQKQRTSLARALVLRPDVLLLDEPFANLDKNLKNQTAFFIRKTQREFGITTLCVTHDQAEAFLVSDRVGIMHEGKLMQMDTPENLYSFPSSLEAALFTGIVHEITPEEEHFFIHTSKEHKAPLCVRPSHLVISKCSTGPFRVTECTFNGLFFIYTIALTKRQFTVYSFNKNADTGDSVSCSIINSFGKE